MEYTDVYFKGLSHVFKVSSVLAQFELFGRSFTIHWYGAIIASQRLNCVAINAAKLINAIKNFFNIVVTSNLAFSNS